MTTLATDRRFDGSIPQLYERLLVPLIFAPYAQDLAARSVALAPSCVLELAAGTGVVTRALDERLPASAQIVATDLNPAMLDHAVSLGTRRAVQWQAADALALPFEDGRFDLVVCQFGAMFFTDRPAAYAEARRVLRDGGTLLFSAWDRIEANELADVVTQALATLFPQDPPRFLARTPHGYHDAARIAADVAAGFGAAATIEVVAARSRAASAAVAAAAYCQGTPLRNEIEARGGVTLDEATRHAEQAVAARFGPGPIDAGIQALVAAVRKPG